MDASLLYYVVAAVLAIVLFVVIARNLMVLDRRERERGTGQGQTARRSTLTTHAVSEENISTLVALVQAPLNETAGTAEYLERVTAKVAAVQALGRTGSAEAIRALIAALEDPNSDVRGNAARELGRLRAAEAVPALAAHLGDIGGFTETDPSVTGGPPPRVSNAARAALEQIGTPEALAALAEFDREPYTAPRPPDRDIPEDLLPTTPPPAPSTIPNREIPPELLTPEPEAPVREALFSAYYPKEMKPNDWQPLVAYVFRPDAQEAVSADAQEQLGERMDDFRRAEQPARQAIAEGALITATPQLDGFRFNPPSLTYGFYEEWQRFDFKLRAESAVLDQAANGRITFTVEGVIVADIPLSVYVGENVSAGATASTTNKPYDAIFISYSRQDKQIVERVERAYRALGLEALRDLMTLRSGEEWRPALLGLIDRADVFQLFWSSASAQSEHVRMEWEYALKVSPNRLNFIRPVYWESPIPSVPDELRKYHFAYQPELAK